MKLIQLEYFVEVVNQKNFTKAAEQLCVSQSTVSKSIRALETEFNTELIDHNSKSFRLTSDGEIFMETAQHILQNYQSEVIELQRKLNSKQGSLSLAIPPVTITAVFTPIIRKFKDQYPNIRLKIYEVGANTAKKMVDDGTADIGAVIQPFSDSNYEIKKITESEATLLVNDQHRLAGRKSVRFAELEGEKFMILTENYMLHDIIIRNCINAGFVPNIEFESTQWDLLVDMVKMNQGISILPKPIVDKFHPQHVREIHLTGPEFPWIVTMIYRKDKFLTQPMRCFMNMPDLSGDLPRMI
ncbi:MAG: LysR family transcriptional regulator [Eubacteriaceae bacterium]|jgi:DNA-binding transcriptional LysR family regulator